MWDLVELREIRVFLVLYEELHFGRTAERLRLSQTRVSQTIQELETKLGSPLFTRTSRRVAVTAAGQQLYERIAPLYQELHHTLRDVHETGLGVTGELRLGLSGPSAGGQSLPEIIQLFESRHPGCSVEVSEIDANDPLGPLRRRELDLLAANLPIEQPDITVGPLLRRDRRLLAVAADHPLAERDRISIEEIADFETHDHGGNFPPEALDAWSPPLTPSGRRIHRRHLTSPTFSHIFALVATGEIVHFATDPVFLLFPGIVYVPIDDLPPIDAALIWLTGEDTAAIRGFVDAVHTVVGERF
jgi:DNA-binding transcriptional LysR family regulator